MVKGHASYTDAAVCKQKWGVGFFRVLKSPEAKSALLISFDICGMITHVEVLSQRRAREATEAAWIRAIQH